MEPKLTIAVFAFSITQIIKERYNIKGGYNQIICVALGALGTYLYVFQPYIWDQLSMVLIGLGVTGTVSYAHERAKKKKEAIDTEGK